MKSAESRPKLFANRTGLMHSFVIALILLLIAFGFVMDWLYKSGAIIDDEADVNLCRATLAVQWKTRTDLGVIDANSPLGSSCKRRTLTIGTDRVTLRKQSTFSIEHAFTVYLPDGTTSPPVGGKSMPVLKPMATFKDLNKPGESAPYTEKDIVASVFAESMKRCWTMGLEGDVKIMDAETTFAKSNVCVLCEAIDIDRNTQHSVDGTDDPKWLTNYLENTMIPSKRVGILQSYASYLDRDSTKQSAFPKTNTCAEEIGLRDNEIADGSYATVLVRRFSDIKDGGCMTTAVVSTSALRHVCNYVAN